MFTHQGMPPSMSHNEPQQRPDSRASTTSAVSQQHDNLSHIHADPKHAQSTFMAQGPEAALLQFHQQMRPQTTQQSDVQPHQSYYGATMNTSFTMPDGYHANNGGIANGDFNGGANSIHARQASLPASMSGATDVQEEKRKKGSAVTATNDRELREMLSKNQGRPLSDVAEEVKLKERTPFAEKTKQLFAMLWLRAVCKPAKTSVPRNRVYSQYATRCGTERVVPLNPASFGKLVRVIFPGIQTRRLGVRGESKYHYVDLALDEEPPNPYNLQQSSMGNVSGYGSWNAHHPRRSDSVSTQHINFNSIPRLQADTAAFPTHDTSFEISSPFQATPRGPQSTARAFACPDSRSMQSGSVEAMFYQHTLRFPSNDIPSFTENEPVNLPSIHPYLPPRTNLDDAEALVALYRTHCTSLIDSIRFCKEKQFFRLYTTFHGTLTVPVQKLFTNPNLAPWIEQCDLVMYRTMVRFVSRLTLQAAPVLVINIFANISTHLHGHIAKTFAAQPGHVRDAKLRPAAIFASLLHRLIRVNQSAHAAANLLTIDQNRERMWSEWVTMVNPKRVMEAELPGECGCNEVHRILTSEMRSLLEPLQSPDHGDSPYGFNAYQFEENGGFAHFMQSQALPSGSNGGNSQVSTETVLDRWSAFIGSLPSRFPTAPARTLLHCISAIGTAALRDITIMNGLSYGHWWVLKIFVDELALWLAEMGGFLEDPASFVPTAMPSFSGETVDYQPHFMDSGPHIRPRSMTQPNTVGNQSHAFSASGSRSAQPAFQAPFQPPPQQSQPGNQQQPPSIQETDGPLDQSFSGRRPPTNHETDLDDSGIGMSMMDDSDFAVGKIDSRPVRLEGVGVA